MATSVTATDDNDRPPLRRDSVPVVDLRLLSQSELYALSLSSDSFDLNRCDDVVIPKINRAVFNESAGSRKQTYSRLRLASAESSSSTTKTTTLHRRTPHLRLSHTATSNNINDPEQAENSLIIRMLKQLCKSDPNFQDVDQIEDENDINSNSAVPEFLNTETLGIKRKRGRPRKHENAVFIRPPTAKRIRHNTTKKVVVYDNERDREIVNDRGVTVNMTTLAGLEDPYGPEIRRRTVGMSTEDALLGFLRGLNGQWGSRRKKRRVVDASEFGDALPKGWKLSLCIKKKEGRVWLFCRRYLSPSGRQFESCKEIATYLNSVIGEENLDKQNHVNVNTSDDLASKGGSENVADLVQRDAVKRDSHVDNPSSSPPPLPTNSEEQVTLDAMEVQVGGFFKCLKCSMIFDAKDDLFDHQVLTHGTERSQLGTTITEWVVLEGGIFDCQICHKSFSEKNQYNDHIGCHVKNEIEKSEPLLAPAGELDHNTYYDAHSGDKPASPCVNDKTSSHEESDAYELVHDLNIASHNKQDGHVNADGATFIEESCDNLEENDITIDEVSRTDQAPDVAISQSELFGEFPLSITESNRNPETSGQNRDNVVDDKLDNNLDQGINSESFLLSSFPKDDIGDCATDQVVNRDAVSDTGVTYVDCIHDKLECVLEKGVGKDTVCTDVSVRVLDPASSETLPLKSNIGEEKGFDANIDMHFNGTSNELISENEKVVGESSSGFFLGQFGLDKDGATVVKKLSTKATRSLVSPSIDSVKTVNSETLISSQKQESPQKGGFGYDVNKLSSGFESSRLDGHFDVGTNAFGRYGASGMEGVSTFEEENDFQNRPSVSLWQEEARENKNLGNDEVSFPTMEEPRIQINSENVTETPSNKPEEAKLDDFQIFTSNEAKHDESVASLGNTHNELSRDVLDFNTKSSLEFCSLVPSENEHAFGFQDDVTSLYDRAMEECKHESSERGLLNHFSIADTSDDIFENKMYSTPLDISSNELSLAFGNPHALYSDTIRVEQKKDLEEAFDVHTNLSMVNNSMVDDLKIGRGSVGGLFNLSGNGKSSGFQNNANTGYPGRAWEGFKSDEYKNSGNKFTTGFGSNHGQTHAEVVPSGMWRTGDGNQLRSGLPSSSHAQIPSPSSFHSFNIMSEKAGDGQFRLDSRYNEGFGVGGLRSNRPEPVEFSFLTGRSQHNPHSLQGDSRVFPYNAGMEQQFDSSFWLGKNAMMPNTSGRNQITSVCAWCRNEFHLPPVHSVTQDGIGSLCPSCSAGMSGHVNLL